MRHGGPGQQSSRERGPDLSVGGSVVPWLTQLVEAQRRIAEAGPGPGGVFEALVRASYALLPRHVLAAAVEGDTLVARAVAGGGLGPVLGDEVPLDGTLAGLCLRTGETVVCQDAATDPRTDAELSLRRGTRSSVHVALRHGGESVGVLALTSPDPNAFTDDDARLVSLLGQVGGAALAATETAAALAGERLRLSAATNLTGMGLWRWEARTGELSWSAEMFDIAGQDPSVRPTMPLWESLLHPDDRASCAFEQHIADGPEGRTEALRLRHGDGSWHELLAWSRPQVEEGRLVSVFGATLDVTRQRTAERQMARLAVRDDLTGLANRAVVDERIRRAISALPAAGGSEGRLAQQYGPCVAVILLDLDRFNLVNDTLGHQVGDALLVEVARRLGQSLEPVDGTDHAATIGRLGGDEFVVLLPWVASTGAALDLADWLLHEVSGPVVLEGVGSSLVCSGSMGVAVAAHADTSASQLFREAELAMYRAKVSGRGRVSLFDDQMRAEAQLRIDTEQLLRAAIDEDRLVAVYQPIVLLDGGRAVGVESLVRVREHGGGLAPPAGFIDVAEDTGLIVEIDRWMLAEAVRQLALWRSAGSDLDTVSVNVSARTLSQPDFDQYVERVLKENHLPPDALLLELTEASLVPGGSPAQDAMLRLRGAGICAGVDDFGTGYSSLAYLQDLPVGFVKIDRSFVRRLDGSPRPSAIVRAVIDLSHAHGHVVTAEGVETQAQADLLVSMGCDHAQGWLFGRPALP